MPLTGPQLVHAIRRNFGGIEEENLNPEKIFLSLLPKGTSKPPDLSNIPCDVSTALHVSSHYECYHILFSFIPS